MRQPWPKDKEISAMRKEIIGGFGSFHAGFWSFGWHEPGFLLRIGKIGWLFLPLRSTMHLIYRYLWSGKMKSKTNMNKTIKKTIKITAISLLSLFLIIIAGIAFAIHFIFTPERLTPVVVNTANKTLSIVVKANANKTQTVNGVNIKYNNKFFTSYINISNTNYLLYFL